MCALLLPPVFTEIDSSHAWPKAGWVIHNEDVLLHSILLETCLLSLKCRYNYYCILAWKEVERFGSNFLNCSSFIPAGFHFKATGKGLASNSLVLDSQQSTFTETKIKSTGFLPLSQYLLTLKHIIGINNYFKSMRCIQGRIIVFTIFRILVLSSLNSLFDHTEKLLEQNRQAIISMKSTRFIMSSKFSINLILHTYHNILQ